MDARKRAKIRSEIMKADEFLRSAEILHSNRLFTASAVSSYHSMFHASAAAFLTNNMEQSKKISCASFTELTERLNRKLDPYVGALAVEGHNWGVRSTPEQSENESLLHLHQAKEFCLDVQDLLRRKFRLSD